MIVPHQILGLQIRWESLLLALASSAICGCLDLWKLEVAEIFGLSHTFVGLGSIGHLIHGCDPSRPWLGDVFDNLQICISIMNTF